MKRPFLLLILALSLLSNNYAAGLLLNGDNSISLDLFGGKRIDFTDDLTIEFDMRFGESDLFGQIMIFDNDIEPISLTCVARANNSFSLVLSSLNNRCKVVELSYPTAEIAAQRWLHTQVIFDLQNSTATLKEGERSVTIDGIELRRRVAAKIIFGKCENSLIDIPYLSLRDIRVHSSNKRVDLHFPLDESHGNIVHERSLHIEGHINQPEWLINRHHTWSKIAEFEGSSAAGVCFDKLRGEIVILNEHNMVRYNPISNLHNVVEIASKRGIAGHSAEAIYQEAENRILYYNLSSHSPFQPFVTTLDSSGKIISDDFVKFHNPLHHHAYTLQRSDNSIYIFGGYGHYEYSNTLYRYNLASCEWHRCELRGDNIEPRMHMASGMMDDENMLIYGGVGNEIGRQELGKESYYDLYQINIPQRRVTKLWDHGEEYRPSKYTPTRNIIYDKSSGSIYIMCWDTEQKCYLHSFDLESGRSQIISDFIPYSTNCILSSIYLFFDQSMESFYAVARKSRDDSNDSTIEIYSLQYPPISSSELNIYKEGRGRDVIYIIVITLLATILIIGLFRGKRRVKLKLRQRKTLKLKRLDTRRTPSNRSSSAIYLFGEIEIRDTKGDDITYRFSSKLKQLLTLLLFHSKEGDGGITTEKLSSAMWSHKSVSEAKNIRGVTINHLRTLLPDIGSVRLNYENGKWRLEMEESIYCDLYEFDQLCSIPIDDISIDESTRLVEILSRGAVALAYRGYETIDSFIIEYEKRIMSIMNSMLPIYYESNQFIDVVTICNIILYIDSSNDIANEFKIEALKRMGKDKALRQ